MIPPKPEGAAPSAETISIIREQDFEEADFSKQLDADNDWESEHPIFMTKLPDDMNEGLLALQDLKYNGETPEEVADYCKDRGNEFFAKYVHPRIHPFSVYKLRRVTTRELFSEARNWHFFWKTRYWLLF